MAVLQLAFLIITVDVGAGVNVWPLAARALLQSALVEFWSSTEEY